MSVDAAKKGHSFLWAWWGASCAPPFSGYSGGRPHPFLRAWWRKAAASRVCSARISLTAGPIGPVGPVQQGPAVPLVQLNWTVQLLMFKKNPKN